MRETVRTRQCAGATMCESVRQQGGYQGSVASSVRAEAFDLAAPYGSQAVRGTHFAHDVVDVILYGLLRDVQLRGDFFIGQPVAQQFHHLLFPATETEFNSPGQRRNCGLLLRRKTE